MIQLFTIKDQRGSLTALERPIFAIKRVYYLHGVPRGATRGGHAHKTLQRLLVAVSGAFEAKVNDREPQRLGDATQGLYVGPMEWLELSDFTPNAVCMVFASAEYDPEDYIRDKEEWERLRC